MAESGEIIQNGIEVAATTSNVGSWSLGCDITIEDANADIQEIRVDDIVLSGSVSTEVISVDIDSDLDNVMDLDVLISLDGVKPFIVESQVVPYDDILEITDNSPETTTEKRYAASARSAKEIHDYVSEVDYRSKKNEGDVKVLDKRITALENMPAAEGGGDGYWYKKEGDATQIHTDHDVVVHGNVIVEGDSASAGKGASSEGGGGATALSELTDVLFESEPSDGDVLTYDKGYWKNKPLNLDDYYNKLQTETLISNNITGVSQSIVDLSNHLASMWSIDPDTEVLTTDKDVVINGNLIVKKNSASGGTNDPSTNIGTVDHIIVSGKPYYPDNAGVVDLTEAFEGLQVDVDLSGYLKTTDIAAWAKASTKPTYTKAEVGLGNVDNTADSAKSVLYAATAGSAPASDVYAWAKKSSLAVADVPDLSDKYLPLSGGLMQGTILPNLHNHLEIGEWETSFYAINSNYYRAGSNINNLWLVSGAGAPDRGIVFARTSDGSTYTQLGKWTSVGLGIGTISPEYKLDIEGYVRATKFILNKQESGIWAGSSYSTTYAADSVLINGTHIYLASITTLLSGLNVKSSAVFEQDVTIEGNLIVKGDSASGGTSASNTASLPLSGGTMVSGAGIYNPNGSASYAAVAFNTNANAFGDPYFPTILRSSLDVTLNKAGTTYTLVHTGNISSYALPKSGGALTGDLTIDGNIFIRGISTNPYIRFSYGGQYWYCQAYTTNSKIGIFLGVTSSLSLKVDASGNVTYAGTISGASDIRYKNKKYDYTLDLHSIANAPLFAFTWNDRNDPDPHLGTSAQYWESIVPQLVSGTDFKALDYSTLGVAMGISLAKKTLNHEERIKALESENKALKEQLSELYNGTVC